MEFIKDRRHCARCAKSSACAEKEIFDNFNPATCGCTEWKDKKGQTYSGYTETLEYKWLLFKEYHDMHPIRFIIISTLIVAVICLLIYLFIIGDVIPCIYPELSSTTLN